MERIEVKIPVDGREYKVVVRNIVDNRKNGGDFTIDFYTFPSISEKSVKLKIESELNSICNQALKIYFKFNKERYE